MNSCNLYCELCKLNQHVATTYTIDLSFVGKAEIYFDREWLISRERERRHTESWSIGRVMLCYECYVFLLSLNPSHS